MYFLRFLYRRNKATFIQLSFALAGIVMIAVRHIFGLPAEVGYIGTGLSAVSIILSFYTTGISVGSLRAGRKGKMATATRDDLWGLPVGSILILKQDVVARRAKDGWYVEGRGPFKADTIFRDNNFPAIVVRNSAEEYTV